MKAILPKSNVENGRNRSDGKELTSYWKVIAYSKGEFHQPIDCRCWMGRSNQASIVYCSIWIHDDKRGHWYAGNGSADGYGYHKESAAIGDAISSASVKLYGSPYPGDDGEETKIASIHGCGEESIRAALHAITKSLGYRKFTVVNG